MSDSPSIIFAICVQLRAMLNYCEAAETPFFSFFFTSGGRPVKLTAGGDTDRDRGGGGGSLVKVDLVLATLSIRQPGGNAGTARSQQDHSSPHLSQSQGQGPRMQSPNEERYMGTADASPPSVGAIDVPDIRDRDGVLRKSESVGQSRADLDAEASVRDVGAVLASFTDNDRRLRDSGTDYQVDPDISMDMYDERDRMGSERSSAQPATSSSTPRQGPAPRPIRRKPKRMLDSSSEEEGE